MGGGASPSAGADCNGRRGPCQDGSRRVISQQELAHFKAPRDQTRAKRTVPAISHHDDLLTEESALSRGALLADTYNDPVHSKYDWKQAYFSDGSVIKDQDLGQMVGAAVWRASDEQAFLIQPNGHGPTNTINRAEASAVYHILNDICPPQRRP